MPTKKPPAFHPTQRLERSYERGIRDITNAILHPKLPEQSFQDWIGSLVRKANAPHIKAACDKLARRMVSSVRVTNARTWQEAARRSSQSGKLHRLLQAELAGPTGIVFSRLVRENAELISSVPLDAAKTLADEIAKAAQGGARPKTIAKMTRKRFPELLRSRTHLISRTESAKASSALTQARCTMLNLDWFEWETSQDKRTRKSHKNLNSVLCSWGDLPSPEKLVGEKDYGKYAPGGTFNCRCVILPLLSFSDVSWPHKVYWKGSIKQMNLQEFKRIAGSGIEERTAA